MNVWSPLVLSFWFAVMGLAPKASIMYQSDQRISSDTLIDETLELNSLVNQMIVLEGKSALRITGGIEALKGAMIHLNSADAFVYLTQISPQQVRQELSEHFRFRGEEMQLFDSEAAIKAGHDAEQKLSSNALVRQYYSFGTALNVYRPQENQAALIAWSDTSRKKGESFLGIGFHRGTQAKLKDGNFIQAFKLKKGYMATLAIAKRTVKQVGEANSYESGQQPFWRIMDSKVFVAVEEDLSIKLADTFRGKINFIAIQPWRWVSKKGLCTHNQQLVALNADWSYNWGLGDSIERQPEYSPMMFGKGRIKRNDLWETFVGMGPKYRGSLTHLMGFNEPDHQAQSNMSVAEAIDGWPRFLETGARLVGPSVTEGGHKAWLEHFFQQCRDSNYRVDAIGIHWYDWKGWRKDQNPNADPEAIFERFKAYLAARYQEYQRPLWITEFNANKNREHAVHAAFLELALPYLDSLAYVERYAFFEPFGGKGNFFDPQGRLTAVGKVYRNHQSVPSVTDEGLATRYKYD